MKNAKKIKKRQKKVQILFLYLPNVPSQDLDFQHHVMKKRPVKRPAVIGKDFY
jgi:hypothetical protein